MAYTGATLSLTTEAPLAGPGQIWQYRTTDADTTCDAAGYITDGGNRGMKVGDLVFIFNTTTDSAQTVTVHVVNSISATAPGAANLSLGTAIGSATSGD